MRNRFEKLPDNGGVQISLLPAEGDPSEVPVVTLEKYNDGPSPEFSLTLDHAATNTYATYYFDPEALDAMIDALTHMRHYTSFDDLDVPVATEEAGFMGGLMEGEDA